MIKKYGSYLAGIVTLLFFTSFSVSADVKVSAEGTYDDDNLIVNIYVDTTDTSVGADAAIVSYGVKMTYDLNLFLPSPVVTKNDTDWYFGTQTDQFPTDNADPDTTTDGIVVIVGGKIDQNDPMAGVSGGKVLLASVTLARITGAPAPTNASISLDLGKDTPYANFVTIEADPIENVLDGTDRLEFLTAVISSGCNLQGDITGDGIVDIDDYRVLRDNWKATGSNIADITGDGIVDIDDYRILRDNWKNTCN